MVEGYYMDQVVARAICKKYPAYLVAGNERVELQVVKICEGEFRLTQALLQPKSTLKQGLAYHLVINNRRDTSAFKRYDFKLEQYVPLEWTVLGEADHEAPAWSTAPIEVDRHYTLFGCGPSLGVSFAIACQSDQQYRVRAEVRAVGKSKWTDYYLPVENGMVEIGRGMCAGAFLLRDAAEFEVQFSLVDMAGNQSKVWDSPIRFKAPTLLGQE
ncbi:MAG TPA: hypothetical protein VHS96_16195 [Bacteroidia bacterium]|nr:hypothetical protein [Bacteroidia bacterium]